MESIIGNENPERLDKIDMAIINAMREDGREAFAKIERSLNDRMREFLATLPLALGGERVLHPSPVEAQPTKTMVRATSAASVNVFMDLSCKCGGLDPAPRVEGNRHVSPRLHRPALRVYRAVRL
jgi:hypothetical protein